MRRATAGWLVPAALCLAQAHLLHAQFYSEKWPLRDIWAWYVGTGWRVGPNYVPNYAVNAIQMWQGSHFDVVAINRELEWASAARMNTLRVFLHYVPWAEDRRGFLNRLEDFLSVAAAQGLKTALVLLDDTWRPFPKSGEQPEPVPLVANSQWVQNPGWPGLLNDSFQDHMLQPYVRDVVSRFKDDERVLFWDVYNEPGRGFYYDLRNKTLYSGRLLGKVFDWVRSIGPAQPLTSGLFKPIRNATLDPIQALQIARSDFLSFHSYQDAEAFKAAHTQLMPFGRPVMCTEFLARPYNSTFEAILPVAKERWIGALNWGWVAGKTQALIPWDSWYSPYTHLPSLWFQDVMYPNGSAFRGSEIGTIRRLLASTQLRQTRVSPRVASLSAAIPDLAP